MYSLVVNFWKFIIQIFQLCVDLNTLYLYFSIMLPKSHIRIGLLQLIRQYTTYLVLVYITNLILYSNKTLYEFHNSNIVIFSGNDTSMFGYFIGLHRYLRVRKSLLATVFSSEFKAMSLNSKLSKVVSYVQDNKY